MQAGRVPRADASSERRCGEVWECLAVTVRSAGSVQVCAAAPTCGGRLLSGLRRTVVSKEGLPDFWGGNTEVRGANAIRCLFNALGPATCLQTVAPTAGKQPEFTSGVKRSRRRASEAVRTVCLAQTGCCGRATPARSEIIPPAPPCFCRAAAPSAGQGEREDYAPKQRAKGGVQPEGRLSTLGVDLHRAGLHPMSQT